jgi:hypothetical protein
MRQLPASRERVLTGIWRRPAWPRARKSGGDMPDALVELAHLAWDILVKGQG